MNGGADVKINFVVNYVHGGWKPTDTRLGGTERGVVEWAEELTKRGHTVQIFDNDTRGSYEGGGDVCINVKSHDIPPKEPTIYYTNEIDATDKDLSKYGAVVHISEWAAKNVPVNNPNVFVVPHGYDPQKYYPASKIPKLCLYASSPDRGLETLLKAWPEVYKEHPDALLIVTYGATGVDIPGVTCLGDVDEDTMADLFKTADIWCHPCTGIELQCIAGLKAQASGCWPVIIPAMALQETVKYGDFATEETYAQTLIDALTAHPKPPSIPLITIEESTNKLLDVVQFVLEKGK